MTALVTKHLPLVAGAPDGIKGLRGLILELAVRGRLVRHDPNELPVVSLLERISDAQMVRKAKGRMGAIEAGLEAAPYEVPQGWQWVQLGDLLSKIGAGSTPLGGKQAYVSSGVKFLRSQNVWNEGLRLDGVALIPVDTHQKMAGTHVVPGDILFNITGASIGRCAIVPESFDTGNVSQHVTIIRPCVPDICGYLHKVLMSGLVQDTVMAVQVGVSREGLSIGKLALFPIPLPPVAEQHRIVAKVDELMALCDRLEADQADAEAAHAQLVQALLGSLTQATDAADFRASWQRLSAHFHTLFTTEASIDALKQTVLQLAVMGKLDLPHDADDDVELLLKDIKSRKAALYRDRLIPKPRTYAPPFDTDWPFGIPSTWRWACLGELGVTSTGSTPPTSRPECFGGNTPFIGPGQINTKGQISFGDKSLSDEGLTNATVASPGDILMVCIGGSIGKSAEVQVPVAFNQQINSISVLLANGCYIHAAMMAPYFQSQVLASATGSATPIINRTKWEDICVPVPPLSEQHRIVAKANELMALCEQLKAQLVEACQQHAQLASVLVTHAID
jgi:type I restriction enzyme S subunit